MLWEPVLQRAVLTAVDMSRRCEETTPMRIGTTRKDVLGMVWVSRQEAPREMETRKWYVRAYLMKLRSEEGHPRLLGQRQRQQSSIVPQSSRR